MSHIDSNRRRPAATAVTGVVLLLASLGLAACGGGSSSTTTSTSANASATTPAGTARTGVTGPGAARFNALRECLRKNGVTLPKRAPGQRRGGPGGPSGPSGFLGGAGGSGGPQLPNGVTRAQLQTAIKKCGGGGVRGQFQRRGGRLKNPAYLPALTKFATCMRENDVNVPAPNTSGNGPIFDTKGIDTHSPQFEAAEKKCQSLLSAAFRRTPGSAPGGGPPRSNEAPGASATG
jgi:hypothetical protein